MKRQYLLTTAGLALVAVALILSCGGSGNGGTNPYTKITGDPNDPIYVTMRNTVVYRSIGISQSILKEGFSIEAMVASGAAGAPQGSPRSADSVVDTLPVWDSTGQYWTRTIIDTAIDTAIADTSIGTYVDSVQFLEGATPVRFPDSTKLTALKIGSRWQLRNLGTVDSLLISLDATITGQPQALTHRGDVVVNGTGFFAGCNPRKTVSDTNSACNRTYAFSLRHQDMHFNVAKVLFGTECPSSGFVKHTGILASDCQAPADSLDYEKPWSSVATYAGQTYKFTIENSSTRWIFETPCRPISSSEGVERPAIER